MFSKQLFVCDVRSCFAGLKICSILVANATIFLICYQDSHVCNAITYTTQDNRGVKMYIQFCYHKISFVTRLVLNLVAKVCYPKKRISRAVF